MIKLYSLLIILFAINSGILQAQSNDEKLKQVEIDLKAAVDSEDYGKAGELKKEKEIRVQINAALEKGDFAKAAELKKQLTGEEPVKKRDVAKKSKSKKSSSYVKTVFETLRDPNVKPEFPSADIMYELPVFPIGEINGISIGFSIEIDSDVDIDGYSDSDYEITLFFKNTSGKKIVFDSPLDILGTVKFTGEEVVIYMDKYETERLGGKCPFFAEFLDHEDGKYVMHPDEYYEGDYSINQDSESWLELIWLRRLKPLWVETNIPAGQYNSSGKTNFLFFPDVDLSKSANETENGFVTRKVKLPSKKIECTSAIRGLSLKTPLKKEGNNSILFENDRIKVVYFINEDKGSFNKSSGYMKYPIDITIYNKTNELIKGSSFKGKAGYFTFHNSYTLWLRMAKKSNVGWYSVDLEPKSSYQYTDKVTFDLYSGELFEGKTFSKRALVNDRTFIPSSVYMKKKLVLSSSELASVSSDGKTKVHVMIKSVSPEEIRKEKDMEQQHYMNTWNKSVFYFHAKGDPLVSQLSKTATITTVEITSGGGDYRFVNARNKPAKQKKIDKLLEGKIAIGASLKMLSLKDGHESFIIIGYGKEIKIVDKAQFEEEIEKDKRGFNKVTVKY